MGDLLHLLRAVLAEPDETREERESVVGEDQAVRQEQRLELLYGKERIVKDVLIIYYCVKCTRLTHTWLVKSRTKGLAALTTARACEEPKKASIDSSRKLLALLWLVLFI